MPRTRRRPTRPRRSLSPHLLLLLLLLLLVPPLRRVARIKPPGDDSGVGGMRIQCDDHWGHRRRRGGTTIRGCPLEPAQDNPPPPPVVVVVHIAVTRTSRDVAHYFFDARGGEIAYLVRAQAKANDVVEHAAAARSPPKHRPHTIHLLIAPRRRVVALSRRRRRAASSPHRAASSHRRVVASSRRRAAS